MVRSVAGGVMAGESEDLESGLIEVSTDDLARKEGRGGEIEREEEQILE